MAAKRLRTVLVDVSKDKESFEDYRNEKDTSLHVVDLDKGTKKNKRFDEIKKAEDNIKTQDKMTKKSSQLKAQKTQKSVQEKKEKIRASNKCFRIRKKQAENIPATVPHGIDENKPKWRKYLDFFRKKRSGNVPNNQERLSLTNADEETKVKPKNKIGVLQRLRNLLKRRNKVTPMAQKACKDKPEHERISGNGENEQDRYEEEGDNQSLNSVSLRSSLCTSTTSVNQTFEDQNDDNISSQNAVCKGNKTGIERSVPNENLTQVKAKKRLKNDDKYSIMWDKVTEMANNHKKLPPLENVVIDVDITTLKKKTKKPSCVGKEKKERNPYDLDMKMIVAEHNRKNMIDGRVTPLKMKHEKIVEMKLFKSCETEAEKNDLRKKLAKRNQLWMERVEIQKKEVQEKNERRRKMRNRLVKIKAEKEKRDMKLPCYFEVPVNRAPRVKPLFRPQSALSNNGSIMSGTEQNQKVSANRVKQLVEKREKLQSRNQRVRSVCEQMKMLPPRIYGDNEFPDDGDNSKEVQDKVSSGGCDLPKRQ